MISREEVDSIIAEIEDSRDPTPKTINAIMSRVVLLPTEDRETVMARLVSLAMLSKNFH